jgi:hypothetical protein
MLTERGIAVGALVGVGGRVGAEVGMLHLSRRFTAVSLSALK